MRRKSERNKAKGSPEKKVEKPTRRTTRRRGKASPSPSPERGGGGEQVPAEDSTSNAPYSEDDKECDVDSRQGNEEQGVSSSDLIKSVLGADEEDSGSVWKVARADASPGEIQKLKLCRQRNISEASDSSQSKRKSNKWPDSGEGGIEEVDSVDEQIASSQNLPICENTDDPSSLSCPAGQDSNQEVSDYKENLPETTSANLSDDQTNVDQQADYKENLPETTSAGDTLLQPANYEESQSSDLPIDNPIQTSDSNEYAPSNQQLPVGQQSENSQKQSNIQATPEKSDAQRKAQVVDNETLPDTEATSSNNENHLSNDKVDDNVTQDTSSTDANEKKNEHVAPSSDVYPNVKKDSSFASDAVFESSDDEQSTSISSKRQEKEADSSHNENDCNETQVSSQAVQSTDIDENSMSTNMEPEIELSESNMEKDDILEINDKTDDLNVSLSVSKPAKVALKRSFSARLSTEKKAEETNARKLSSSETTQNKENHADNEQPDGKKRRRWGVTTSTDVAPAFSISTDSLKALVPGAKPVSVNEVRLGKDEDEEKEREKNADTCSKPKNDSKNDNHRKVDDKLDNHIASRRKISIKETPRPTSPSPPEPQATKILLIKNLVRPFTLNQIKELLSRTGTIAENGFWMDRIKSKCFVEYANEDQAFETRQALHGVSWPPSNPKKLIVEYATKEDMETARDSSSKDQPVVRKVEPMLSTDSWQQDQWSRDDRSTVVNKMTVIREWDLGKEDGQISVKEKERERKELEKKKRQRSRSPLLEAHLPPPARKFKKKEEEPPTAKLLDDLFRKTKATPCIYWLPLTNEQIMVKEEMRRQHMAEHARRLEEMRRAERSRDPRRRRSPRK